MELCPKYYPNVMIGTDMFGQLPGYLGHEDLGNRSGHIYALGVGIKSVNTGVVIGCKLNNEKFKLNQLAPWRSGFTDCL